MDRILGAAVELLDEEGAEALSMRSLAQRLGITHFRRTPALNDRPGFLDALATLVREHLASGKPHSTQYPLRCPGCVNPACRAIVNPVPAPGSKR